jgi:hypothetical protein
VGLIKRGFIPDLRVFLWGADEVRQHESSELFLAFHILAFLKQLDKDFFVLVQQKLHAFSTALLVAASPHVQKQRG